MTDKKRYYKMFNGISALIEHLVTIHVEAEKSYIENDLPDAEENASEDALYAKLCDYVSGELDIAAKSLHELQD